MRSKLAYDDFRKHKLNIWVEDGEAGRLTADEISQLFRYEMKHYNEGCTDLSGVECKLLIDFIRFQRLTVVAQTGVAEHRVGGRQP